MKLTTEQVLEFIPHRDPFLFIDTVEDIEIPAMKDKARSELEIKDLLGSKVHAKFYCRKDLDLFRGHFPGFPVLPGVIQTEMMAQASMFILYKYFEKPQEMKLDVALLNIDHAKFRRPVLPEMKLDIHAECMKIRGPVMSYDAHIMADGQVMSESSFLASVRY